MNILERYLARVILLSSALVLLVILSLYSFMALMEEVGDIGKGGYTLYYAIEYIALTLPRRIYELFPLAALLGTMLGLGMLASHRELMVMLASGMSMQRLIAAIMKIALLMMTCVFLLGELVTPTTEQMAQNSKALALDDEISLHSKYGVWIRDGLTFVNVRAVLVDGSLSNLTIYSFSEDRRLEVISIAKRAYFIDDEWILEGIQQSFIEKDKVITKELKKARWQSLLRPELINIVAVSPINLSIIGLQKYISYLQKNNLNSERYELAFWMKIATPLSTAAMVLLAIPFAFGRLRSVGMGTRMVVGVLIGISFFMFNQIIANLGLLYHIPPIISAGLPILLALGAAFLLLRRLL